MWLGEKDFNKIPIIVTAFGDIFYYRKLEDNENDVSLLDIHYREIKVCGYSYHWAVVEKRVNPQKTDIGVLDSSVIVERRGLEWLINSEEDWYNILLDT